MTSIVFILQIWVCLSPPLKRPLNTIFKHLQPFSVLVCECFRLLHFFPINFLKPLQQFYLFSGYFSYFRTDLWVIVVFEVYNLRDFFTEVVKVSLKHRWKLLHFFLLRFLWIHHPIWHWLHHGIFDRHALPFRWWLFPVTFLRMRDVESVCQPLFLFRFFLRLCFFYPLWLVLVLVRKLGNHLVDHLFGYLPEHWHWLHEGGPPFVFAEWLLRHYFGALLFSRRFSEERI
jgi:hypothetical protein